MHAWRAQRQTGWIALLIYTIYSMYECNSTHSHITRQWILCVLQSSPTAAHPSFADSLFNGVKSILYLLYMWSVYNSDPSLSAPRLWELIVLLLHYVTRHTLNNMFITQAWKQMLHSRLLKRHIGFWFGQFSDILNAIWKSIVLCLENDIKWRVF
jgi:hypothetical protein